MLQFVVQLGPGVLRFLKLLIRCYHQVVGRHSALAHRHCDILVFLVLLFGAEGSHGVSDGVLDILLRVGSMVTVGGLI